MDTFVFYYTISIAANVLFLYGFFPVQQNQLQDIVLPPQSIKDINLNLSHCYRPHIERLVLIVIDALRLDFVTLDNMPFLVKAYNEWGCFVTVKVESPTVTLPRIKSLTTGSVPQFSDIILNLLGTENLSTRFLHHAVQANKTAVYYGDDTWLKLYPETFKRFEVVTSFYVNDFYEVDSNVTRNVRNEIKNDDWDIMVLHYLGLDHIGHVQGPFSNLIHPKLQEMDNVINEIFLASKTWNKSTLIAVTGDHGMKNSGGHGGATFEETHVPLVFVGIPCHNCSVAQSDIPTTLSTLLGLILPSSSVGRSIYSLLGEMSYDRLLYILRYNTIVLQKQHRTCDDIFDSATDLHYSYLKTGNRSEAMEAKLLYESCTESISNHLIQSSIKQDEYILLLGIAIVINCFSIIISTSILNKNRNILHAVFLALILVLCLLFENYFYKVLLVFAVVAHLLLNIFISLKMLIRFMFVCNPNFSMLLTLLHSVSLTSSSFIEEEHQVWYFFYGTFLLIQYVSCMDHCKSFDWLALFVILRFSRMINQTGDKWAHLPDLTQWLLLDDNFIYLRLLHCISLVLILVSSKINEKKLSGIILCLIFMFHFYDVHSTFLGKMIWLGIVLHFCYNVYNNGYLTSIIQAWVLICSLLLRPYNAILLPACIYASSIINRHTSNNLLNSTIIHIWLGNVFFFCQGHSNSLASIEVASGYVGLNEYNLLIVTGQILCHTYAFPLLTTLLLLKNSLVNIDRVWLYKIGHQLLVLVTTCILIFIQRQHLFVWTVFAPKLLTESCHSAVLLLQIIVFYSVRYLFKI